MVFLLVSSNQLWLTFRLRRMLHKDPIIPPVLVSLHWLPTNFRFHLNILVLDFRALHGQAAQYISDLLKPHASCCCPPPPTPTHSVWNPWGSGFSGSGTEVVKLFSAVFTVQTPLTLIKCSWRYFHTDKISINLLYVALYVCTLLCYVILLFFVFYCEALYDFYLWKVLFKYI